jgi:excisionase family DNA binding protein
MSQRAGSLAADRRRKPYRVSEVAAELDVHPATVYRAIASGRLRALRVGMGRGAIRVPADEFEAFKARLSAVEVS